MFSMNKMSLLVLLSLGIGNAIAQTAASEVILDKKGMPICILDQGKEKGFIRLIWNKDSFEKDIFYEHFSKGSKSLCSPSKRKYLSDKFPEIDSKKIVWEEKGKRFVLPSDQRSLSINGTTLELSSEVQKNLNQARLGGNIFLAENEDTPEEYLTAHPIDDYNVEVNREITVKHGAGFSAGVYKAWIESRPENADFKSYIAKSLKNGVQKANSEYTTVFVKGFGHSLGGNDRYQPFIDGVRSHGIGMQVMYTEPYGRTPDNTYALKLQLNELLAQGKKLIVVCGSNGCLQLMAAMSQLREKLEVNTPKGYGKISAMLNLSGVFYGSFAADWATGFPKWMIVKKSLHQGLQAQRIEIPKFKLNSFKDLRMDFVSQYVNDHLPNISQKTKYFNVIGVPQHNGLVKDPEIGLLQVKTIRPFMKPGFGANDGYVEFPGTTFRDSWAPEVYTVSLDSSHAVLDGRFEGTSMSENKSRNDMIGGLMNFILGKIK